MSDQEVTFESLARDAKEEGYPEPSRIAVGNALEVLKKLREVSSVEYDVYSMPQRDVSIESSRSRRHSVVFYCSAEGKVRFYLNLDGSPHSFKSYDSLYRFPCELVREGLKMYEERCSTPEEDSDGE